jgi:hypothetical protein
MPLDGNKSFELVKPIPGQARQVEQMGHPGQTGQVA